jgi:hypothetical protein
MHRRDSPWDGGNLAQKPQSLNHFCHLVVFESVELHGAELFGFRCCFPVQDASQVAD